MHITKEQVDSAVREVRSLATASPFTPIEDDAKQVIQAVGQSEEFRKYATASLLKTTFTLALGDKEADTEKMKRDPLALGDAMLPALAVAFYAGLKLGQKEAETAILKSWEQTQQAS